MKSYQFFMKNNKNISHNLCSEGYCDCLFYPFRWLRAQICPCVCIPGTLPTPTFCWKRMWFEGTYANKITKQIFGKYYSVIMLYCVDMKWCVSWEGRKLVYILFRLAVPFQVHQNLMQSKTISIIWCLINTLLPIIIVKIAHASEKTTTDSGKKYNFS